MLKKKFWVIHCIATCQDCEWSNENYKNAQATGFNHAKRHKHLVHVEVGICGDYDGRKK